MSNDWNGTQFVRLISGITLLSVEAAQDSSKCQCSTRVEARRPRPVKDLTLEQWIKDADQWPRP